MPCTRHARFARAAYLPTCLPSYYYYYYYYYHYYYYYYYLPPTTCHKVVDLGHARELPEGGRAYTMLGTPEQVD